MNHRRGQKEKKKCDMVVVSSSAFVCWKYLHQYWVSGGAGRLSMFVLLNAGGCVSVCMSVDDGTGGVFFLV